MGHIWYLLSSVNDAKGKRKVLGSNQKLKFNPTELILYCKDLRIIRFCFHEAGPESAKKVSHAEFSVGLFLFVCSAATQFDQFNLDIHKWAGGNREGFFLHKKGKKKIRLSNG